MSIFDQLHESIELRRTPLTTLSEAGGAAKSTTDATTDYGVEPNEMKPSPNTRYRPSPKSPIGSDATMSGSPKAAALRTGKSG